jgi:cell division protein FtsL
MAAAAAVAPVMTRAERRAWMTTPEIHFTKHIDNSRLVKVEDPRRKREMKQFVCALVVLFAVVMFYALQHFSAIQYGYKIEALRSQRDALTEQARQLRLEDAYLRNPERIVPVAQQLGLQTPQVGQVVRLDNTGTENGPVVAQMAAVTVVSSY